MFKKTLSLSVIVCFILTTLSPLPRAHADTVLGLPAPGTMVNLSPAYEPALIKGLTVHKDNPFLFDFIVDSGNSGIAGNELKKEGDRLVKYFFACLTIPEKDLWVNLSPYEKDKMVPQALGQTALGRDLLAQDYILKQLTASLIYPEKDLGKTFWDRVYAKARQMYGTTQIPVNTFNKVWIVADKATVYEHGQTAFVMNGHLKVMLEEDYLALRKHVDVGVAEGGAASPASAGFLRNAGEEAVVAAKQSNREYGQDPNINRLGSQIVRQIILPEIEKEVNTGKNFSTLRQIFNSLILASWYKKDLKEALLTQVYANKSKVKGVNLADPSVKEQIYQQYLRAYKKGVFNYIKEDAQPDGQTIPRKYFSGGFDSALVVTVDKNPVDAAQVTMTGTMSDIAVGLKVNDSAMITPDAAMRTNEDELKVRNLAEGLRIKYNVFSGIRADMRKRADEVGRITNEERARLQAAKREVEAAGSVLGEAMYAYTAMMTRREPARLIRFPDKAMLGGKPSEIYGMIMVRYDTRDADQESHMGVHNALKEFFLNRMGMLTDNEEREQLFDVLSKLDALQFEQSPDAVPGLTMDMVRVVANLDKEFAAATEKINKGKIENPPIGINDGLDISKALVEAFNAGIGNFTVTGRPGAGKDTLINSFIEKMNTLLPADSQIETVVTGDYFRGITRLVQGKAQAGDKEKYEAYVKFLDTQEDIPAMVSGKLIKDETAFRIINQILEEPRIKNAKHIFFNGFPRNMVQWKAIQDGKIFLRGKPLVISFFLDIDLPREVTFERAKQRIQDLERQGKPPRVDDLPETVEIRQTEYDNQTLPMVIDIKGRYPKQFRRISSYFPGIPSDVSVRETKKKFVMTLHEFLRVPTALPDSAQISTPGGIDLNTTNGMQWKVSKDGNGVEMNIDPAMIERVRREGIDSLSPVIFRITPLTSIWTLIGLKAAAAQEL